MICRLSYFQLLRLKSLIDLAISENEEYIKNHDEFLSSLSDFELSQLDSLELRYSDCLAKDIRFLRDLKLSLEKEVVNEELVFKSE